MSEKQMAIWKGVYQSFSEVPADVNVFNTPKWQQGLAAKLEQDLAWIKQKDVINPVTITKDYPITPILAMLGVKKEKVRVLDFGGGLATSFIQASASLPMCSLDYHIVESEAVVKIAREYLSDYSNLFFYETLPEKLDNVDCIVIASTLHYIEDWQGLLEKLLSYNPQYILFTELPAGNVPTFVSSQIYYGKVIPVWFWNIDEFIKHLSNKQCDLIYKSLYCGRYCGVIGPMPTYELPEENQIKYCCNLVFSYKNEIEN